jgi:hypothetical protein
MAVVEMLLASDRDACVEVGVVGGANNVRQRGGLLIEEVKDAR